MANVSDITSSSRPDWLTDSFLAQAYASEGASVEIQKCDQVSDKNHTYRVSVKVSPTEGAAREENLVIKSLDSAGDLKTEWELYSSVFKVLQGYWMEQGQDVEFVPR